MANHDNESELHLEGIRHSDVAYEDRDLGARSIVMFLVVLAVVSVVLLIVVWGMVKVFDRYALHTAGGPQTSSVQKGQAPPTSPVARFPAPKLQSNEVADMDRLRAENDAVLSSYGYVDQQKGIVHIPVQRAMDAVLQKGLPTRPQMQTGQEAQFGSGRDNPAGAAGGTWPAVRN